MLSPASGSNQFQFSDRERRLPLKVTLPIFNGEKVAGAVAYGVGAGAGDGVGAGAAAVGAATADSA